MALPENTHHTLPITITPKPYDKVYFAAKNCLPLYFIKFCTMRVHSVELCAIPGLFMNGVRFMIITISPLSFAFCYFPMLISSVLITHTGTASRAGAPVAAGSGLREGHHVAMLLHQLQQAPQRHHAQPRSGQLAPPFAPALRSCYPDSRQ